MVTMRPTTMSSSDATEHALWEALTARSSQLDAQWLYGVRTTGVFCKLSCASRRPRRENVEFFDCVEKARAAGYRPCKRCRPDARDDGGAIVMACRLLATDEAIETRTVARALDLSTAYFQRMFKRHLGVTPQQYRRRLLAERARAALNGSPSVTQSIYEAGYSSSSRFYAHLGQELGMAPSRARAGAAGEKIDYASSRCNLGTVLVAWTDRGVCWVGFDDEVGRLIEALRTRFPKAELRTAPRHQWVQEVLQAVEHPGDRARTIPLDIRGTAFQERVWQALRAIPLGETRTYGEIARLLGNESAARAVARACATNSIAVLIPCHRVVRTSGELSGYRWGAHRKRELLRREECTSSDAATEHAVPLPNEGKDR